MTVARALSSLSSWLLALLLGLGPLGADVLVALGHAELCACCRTDETEGCCGAEEGPAEPALAPFDDGCPCAAVAPSDAGPWSAIACRNDASAGSRVELERLHRVAAFALATPIWPALVRAPDPAASSESRPPGARHAGGAERVAALGVLRL